MGGVTLHVFVNSLHFPVNFGSFGPQGQAFYDLYSIIMYILFIYYYFIIIHIMIGDHSQPHNFCLRRLGVSLG